MEIDTLRIPEGIGAVRRHAPLAPISSWRIGGTADILVEPDSEAAVAAAVRFAADNRIPLVVIGAASNLLFDDAGVRGMVLRVAGALSDFSFSGGFIRAQAGVMMPRLAEEAARAGLAGFEDLAGIPGTLGGTLTMNGGLPEHPVADRVVEVRTIGFDGQPRRYSASECMFGYRASRFAAGGEIVVAAGLAAGMDDPAAIRARMKAHAESRRNRLPLDKPSAGSVFRRSPGIPAPGRTIEETGLKGARIGDAIVSDKHANFILNLGHASSADVLALVDLVRFAVHARTGHWLETEVRYVRPDGIVTSPANAGALREP
jgi:UDP-N-acetylmuramate dehydrogenase